MKTTKILLGLRKAAEILPDLDKLMISSEKSLQSFRLRSYVRRDSRLTFAQERAFIDYYPRLGLSLEEGVLNQSQVFGCQAALFLEIGFGMGVSLLECAKKHPDQNFIGVETHKPGIGALFICAQENELANLRVYYGDVIDVLEKTIPDVSLNGVHIFFPDPWPKRRHHQRRLIQADFVSLVTAKLKQGGELHLATDWEDYASHMMRVVSQEEKLTNMAGEEQFAERSRYRPVVTKFERRALRENRIIRELQFQKV
jgi:tRNA (guanine-N7-)-methyltransferase